jgi:hypothetical protein
MNDSKWRSVLGVLAERRVQCKIKLVCHQYAAKAAPGEPVVVAYDVEGKPHFLRADVIWQATSTQWDSASLGPFHTRDIDWLELATDDFGALRLEFPKHLELVTTANTTAILGYSVV